MKTPQQQQHNDTTNSIAENTGEGTVSYAPPDPFGREQVTQREVSESEHDDDDDREAVVAFENAFNTAVQQAHHHVIAAPRLGALANLDGHTSKWVEDWTAAMNGNAPGSLATSFGYAIESLTTMVYLPAAPQGMTIQLQGVRGGTRPDLILRGDNGDIAWMDITASASAGHIWDKVGWDQQPHVSEVTYPSLAMEHRQLMVNNNNEEAPVGFDAGDFEEQIQQAIALRDLRRERWQDIGPELLNAYRDQHPVGRMLAELDPRRYRQNPMLHAIIAQFNLGIDGPEDGPGVGFDAVQDSGAVAELRRNAPHILRAVGLVPATYGFIGGGALAGEGWLLHNDPNLAQPEDLVQEEEEEEDVLPEGIVVDETDEVDMEMLHESGAGEYDPDTDMTLIN